MDLYGGGLFIPVRLWSKIDHKYKWISLTFDTGASVTTISPEIFFELGYEPLSKQKTTITTASGVEHVSYHVLDAIKIGDIELKNVGAYAHKFPEESFSIGVIGLNVLHQFDIELLFSQGLIRLSKI
jgi:predicted aspartyl protease